MPSKLTAGPVLGVYGTTLRSRSRRLSASASCEGKSTGGLKKAGSKAGGSHGGYVASAAQDDSDCVT